MSITMSCAECKAKSQDGVLEHTAKCSANLFKPQIRTDYLRPPALELHFDTPEEQAEWERKLKGGFRTNALPKREQVKETPPNSTEDNKTPHSVDIPTEDVNQWLIRRCKSKDTHDFPDLYDGVRCANCKLWEEVDAYVATKCNEMLDEIFQGRESIFVEKDSHNTRVLYRHNFEDESKK